MQMHCREADRAQRRLCRALCSPAPGWGGWVGGSALGARVHLFERSVALHSEMCHCPVLLLDDYIYHVHEGGVEGLTTESAGCTSGAASAASAASAAVLMLRQWQNIGGGRTTRLKNAPLRASRPTAMQLRARISPPSLRGRIRTRHRMRGRFAPFSLSLSLCLGFSVFVCVCVCLCVCVWLAAIRVVERHFCAFTARKGQQKDENDFRGETLPL